jgi:hypothetical protein
VPKNDLGPRSAPRDADGEPAAAEFRVPLEFAPG